MLRSQYEEQLINLHNQFYEMGTSVSAMINRSVQSFIDHDRVVAQRVIEEDDEINEMEIRLEKKSFEMIALQQPLASDLRTIITIMKASSDLERMGDHAVSIAKATIAVKGETRIADVEQAINEMSKDVKKMVDEVLAAYIKQDVEGARAISHMDVKVNKAFAYIHRHVIREMKEDAELIVAGQEYLQVAGYLERIGDYVTNICEWIVYLSTGKITELSPLNDEDEV